MPQKLRLKVHKYRSSSAASRSSTARNDDDDDDELQYRPSTSRSHSQRTPPPPSLSSQSQQRKKSDYYHNHHQLRGESTHSEADKDGENDGQTDDTQLIQVAIRCRPRKRRRRHKSQRGWLGRRPHSGDRDDDDDDEVGSSNSSDSDSGSNPGGGVIEYDSSTSRHHHHNGRHHSTFSHNRGHKPSLYIQAHAHAVGIGGSKRRFEFDFVFPPWIKQLEVYEQSVQQQITHVLQAHEHFRAPTHATIVAYGQTGTGKTYTMGMLTSIHDEVERGIIPRAISQIMEYAKSYNHRGVSSTKASGEDYLVVSMSYLQIYLETIQDLLVFPVDGKSSSSNGSLHTNGGRRTKPGGGTSDLQVRQRQNQAFYVEGLSEYEVTSLDDVHVLLETAAHNRILAATARNKTSSRSHTLLTISLKRSTRMRRRKTRHRRTNDNSTSSSEDDDEVDSSDSSEEDSEGSQEDDDNDDGDNDENAYTISFVDLAGSERVDGTLHFLSSTRKRQELRIREAKFINKSLSALGSVIAALAQPKHQQQQQRPSVVPAMLTKRGSDKSVSIPSPSPASLSATQRHIRFRDSQLTKLLQSRLTTGRGRLLLIATVDDQVANLMETLSTLKFAAQCRRVELRSPRSKAEAAAKKRKDLLLEQVFLEMKTTYEEREAALHREYQSRLQVLEEQLQVVKNEIKAQLNPKVGGESVQFACYAALCALVDQTAASNGDTKQRHPAIDSFQSENEIITYIKELYVVVQTAVKSSTTGPQQLTSTSHSKHKAQVEDIQQASQRIDTSTGPAQKSSSSVVAPDVLAKPSLVSTHVQASVVPAPAIEAKKEESENEAKSPHPKPEKSLTRRFLATTQLLPRQEDEFQAIARLLLSTPASLRTYHVNPDEEIDSSFSQIDQV